MKSFNREELEERIINNHLPLPKLTYALMQYTILGKWNVSEPCAGNLPAWFS